MSKDDKLVLWIRICICVALFGSIASCACISPYRAQSRSMSIRENYTVAYTEFSTWYINQFTVFYKGKPVYKSTCGGFNPFAGCGIRTEPQYHREIHKLASNIVDTYVECGIEPQEIN